MGAALIPVWIFWALTPVLLVRDGGRRWRDLLIAGLAGVVIDGIVLAALIRVGFPILLEGWTGFGPIGVAMTLMAWCGVLAIGWVVMRVQARSCGNDTSTSRPRREGRAESATGSPLEDLAAGQLQPFTIGKQKNLLEKRLVPRPRTAVRFFGDTMRRTISGFTMTSAVRQAIHVRESHAQSHRSAFARRGRRGESGP
jgi:hypothetical protein